MSSFPFSRPAALEELGRRRFDVLVVGAGITGAGVALDAAARGLSVALVDQADFSSGTSSRSSKLVHGGLRYLQQREFRLVYENLAERHLLLGNASHLVHPLAFLVPVLARPGPAASGLARAYSSALWLYDLTGGLRIGRRHRRLPPAEALAHLPTLRPELVSAAFVYWDAWSDDARLTLAVARTACLDFGAVAANYARVLALAKRAGRVSGAVVDAEGAGHIEVEAEVVVNATGVWVDELRQLDQASAVPSVRPAKGIHLTLPRDRLPADMAAVLPVPGDRRSIFVIPWQDQVYVGTTDTDYDGPLDEPPCRAEDVDYLLGAVNSFVTQPVSAADVVAAWAGLRPLLARDRHGRSPAARTADLSRRHQVSVAPSGLVTVTGGKLTTYRRMAADTVDRVVALLQRGRRTCPTRHLALRGRGGPDPAVPEPPRAHLASRYGSEAAQVWALAQDRAGGDRPLVEGLPYLAAEAVWAARHEMALTLDDVLSRRTRALLQLREPTLAAAPRVAGLVGPELGWGPEEARRQLEALRRRHPAPARP
ncbi:MAG TPA: glycerol-3-phosphate dehydrogenase/oxidase [Acidimicrobiales bacterium]|nr:glycerol-3-phosphate dehydrogenase/oxidase [Acidimicrobiales bacterium]